MVSIWSSGNEVTLVSVGMVGGGRIQTIVRLGMRGTEDVRTESRPLTKLLAGEGEGCGCGQTG